MSVNYDDLPAWAQQQVAKKLANQSIELLKRKNASKEKSENKYHNTPDNRTSAGGKEIKFGGKKEARRYDELMVLLRAGKIRDLKLQPQFTLQESYITPEGERIRAIRYHADFSYDRLEKRKYVVDGGGSTEEAEEWVYVVEDVKGGNVTKTEKYKLKKKLLKERMGITIQELDM